MIDASNTGYSTKMQEREHESLEIKMSRGIAPIKSTFIKIGNKRPKEPSVAASTDGKQAGQDGSQAASKVAPERKSRRAFKKVWRRSRLCYCSTNTLGHKAGTCVPLFSQADQQMLHRQEAREKRATAICNRFIKGTCPFGDKCKFSHDVAAYVNNKPADMPGQCPFTAYPECPFGKLLNVFNTLLALYTPA